MTANKASLSFNLSSNISQKHLVQVLYRLTFSTSGVHMGISQF